jgi:ubiquinone/menaquinone biosynthesis C-methylase UbiE
MKGHHYCHASFAFSLDNFLRRLLHKPEKILSPFIKEGMTVIDIGCGPGFFTAEIAKLVGDRGRVIAADMQQVMLDKMSLKVKKYGLDSRVEPHLCHRERSGIEKKADFIFAFWMVHEIPGQQGFIEEMKSLLKQDGRILVSEPKIHVTEKSFNIMAAGFGKAGLHIIDRPVIPLSRTLLAAAETN